MSVRVHERIRCMAPVDALDLVEQMEDQISPMRDTDLAYAMNTIRYLLAREIPVEPVLHDGKTWKFYYTCGRCGAGLRTTDKYCGCCGQKTTDNYLGRKKTRREQEETVSPKTKEAIATIAKSIEKDQRKIDLDTFLEVTT